MTSVFRKALTDFTADKRFSEILTGSVWAVAAQVLATILGLVTSVVIARVYGAEMVGIVAVIQSFLLLATIITVMGTNTSILRLIPEHIARYSASSAFALYRNTQYLVAGASIVVGVLLYVASSWIARDIFGKPYLGFYFALASCFVVFRSLMDLNVQAIRGLRLVKSFAFVSVLPSATVLIALLVIPIMGVGKNSPVYAQMTAWACTALIGVGLMQYHFRQLIMPNDIVDPIPLGEILRISSPMMMTASMTYLIGQTGVVFLAIFSTEVDVGYYAVAVKLATLVAFLLSAINSMAAPKFSELYSTGDMDELFYIAKKSTRLIFWSTAPILLFLIFFGEIILAEIFGPSFDLAYPVMLILIAGQLVNCMSGSTGIFMNMTGNEKIFRNILIGAGLLNVTLSILLVPRLGILGAGISAALCMAIWNLVTLLYIKRKYGRSIGYLPFLKTI